MSEPTDRESKFIKKVVGIIEGPVVKFLLWLYLPLLSLVGAAWFAFWNLRAEIQGTRKELLSQMGVLTENSRKNILFAGDYNLLASGLENFRWDRNQSMRGEI